jgi:hypothetical protein
MGEVVNLRMLRKRAARRKAAEQAVGNRQRHGRSKEERTLEAAKSAKAQRDLDKHHIARGDGA